MYVVHFKIDQSLMRNTESFIEKGILMCIRQRHYNISLRALKKWRQNSWEGRVGSTKAYVLGILLYTSTSLLRGIPFSMYSIEAVSLVAIIDIIFWHGRLHTDASVIL